MAIVSAKWEELLKKSRPTDLEKGVVIDILSRLPVKSIIRFKSTSKPWYNFLNEPKFIQMHLNRAISSGKHCLLLRHLTPTIIQDREIERIFSTNLWTGGFHVNFRKEVYSFRSKHNFAEVGKVTDANSTFYLLVGSINGIVCMINEDKDYSDSLENITLWNPALVEHKILPRPFVRRCDACKTVGVGFAYVQSSNDYKVIAIMKVRGTEICKVMVYSLSTGCWDESIMIITGRFLDLVSRVNVNGILHWLNYEPYVEEHFIICFDVKEEKFSTIQLPVFSSRVYRVNILPSPPGLGESLVAFTTTYNDGCALWFMGEYGVEQSWIKLYSIPQRIGYKMEPLGWFNQGVLICVISENRLAIFYNLSERTVSSLCVRVTTPACYGTYTPSLVSLGGRKPLPCRHPAYSNTSTNKLGKRKLL